MSGTLNELTRLGIFKESERLEIHRSLKILDTVEEYSLKPYVLKKYLLSLVQRKTFKRELTHHYLLVIDAFFEPMSKDEDCTKILKNAIYVIEDNL